MSCVMRARIYTNVNVPPDSIIEDINYYLTKDNEAISVDLPPYQVAEQMVLKLSATNDLGQVAGRNYLNGWNLGNFNYCSLALIWTSESGATTQSPLYFFRIVRSALSNDTLTLVLTMDITNTIGRLVTQGILNFSEKTMIHREHVDRFQSYSSKNLLNDSNYYAYRLVDRVREGLSIQQERKLASTLINDSGATGKFYLIYKTSETLTSENLSNPISCFLTADEALQVLPAITGSTYELQPSNFSRTVFVYFTGNFTIAFSVYDGSAWETITSSGSDYDLIQIRTDGSQFKVRLFGGESAAEYNVGYNTLNMNIRVTTATGYYIYSEATADPAKVVDNGAFVQRPAGTSAITALTQFAALDRTDSKLMRVLTLPYSPNTISKDSEGSYSVEGFTYDDDTGFFKLDDVGASFINNKVAHTPAFAPYKWIHLDSYATSEEALAVDRLDIDDSKISSSEFTTLAIYFDSFAWQFYPERQSIATDEGDIVGADEYAAFSVFLDFKQTNTINSNFYFRCHFDEDTGRYYYSDEGIFGEYLNSSRNNEQTLYNNDFLNYIRSGYNYDQKSKALSNASTWVSVLAQAGTLALSGAVAGSIAGSAGAAVGAVVGLAASAVSAGISTISAENQAEKSRAQLLAKASSVNGTDDIDLLDGYEPDLVPLAYISSVPDAIKPALNNLFHYYGYKREMQGKPSIDSRTWFNYLECEPVFVNECIVRSDFMSDFKTALRRGVTFFHVRTIGGVRTWDIQQEKENWETWLIALGD